MKNLKTTTKKNTKENINRCGSTPQSNKGN